MARMARHHRLLLRVFLLGFWALTPAFRGHAASDPSALCEAATFRASQATGVPLDVLQAIALAESGRSRNGRHRPWPWTANFGGQGHFFGNSAEAQLAVLERQAAGSTNFDIGCFQINYRWHGQAFASIAAMFDPETNALYAAGFLKRLRAETGDWAAAAAAYHSRTPEHAERYLARVESILAMGQLPFDADLSAVRENRFPLLQTGAAGAIGSLVPTLPARAGLIGFAP